MTLGICAKHLLNTHTDVSSGARGINVGPSLHLHPNFVYVSFEGTGVPHHSRLS